MAIEKITIQQFIANGHNCIVLDVRSPAEFAQAHIPNAVSVPLFTDEERKVVGTAYKQQSRQIAIKIGLDYFGVKMKAIVEQVEKIVAAIKNKPSNIVVHCWRGGMRSAAIAWLLDLYGFKIQVLIGGYKSYRQWVRQRFEQDLNLTVIGGYTGSGKTEVLQYLLKKEIPVIQLEALANHKGSAFGAIGQLPQPSQEMFENLLAQSIHIALAKQSSTKATSIFIEDESQRIGLVQIPMPFWNTMRQSPICFLDIPFTERLQFIVQVYGGLDKQQLVNAIMRIQKRLGGLETKNAINFLLENNYYESFKILLTYYDKWYIKGLNNRQNLSSLLNKITCNTVDDQNANLLIHETNTE
jgi:tRNA 2-selenouridine synthase